MASIKTFINTQHLAILGDAFLMTSAAFAGVIGTSSLVIDPTGTLPPDKEWVAALSSLLSLAVVVVVPIGVWLLHGRRLSIMAVLGGVLGAASTAVVFFGFVALSMLLGFAVSPVWDVEYAGPLLMLIVVATACVAWVIWLVVGAVRDLANRRDHPRIDALRILSTVVLVVYTAGVAMWIAGNPADDSLDALIFALVAGIAAALAVAGAELATTLSSTAKPAPTPSAPIGLDSTTNLTQ
ncbi:MAG: hypothetical protein U0R64_07445 [Candidatus Nanopelagicales bacterium]